MSGRVARVSGGATGVAARPPGARRRPRADPASWRLSISPTTEKVLLVLLGFGVYSLYRPVGELGARWGEPTTLYTPLDGAIPFVPVFVVFYAAAFVLPAVWTIVCVRLGTARAVFRRFVFAVIGLVLVHYAIYLALPTTVEGMRADVGGGEGFLDALVRREYARVPVTNAFPSLHVGSQVLMAAILWGIDRRAGLAATLIAVPICLSTVFVRTHFLVDVPGGLATAAFAYFVLYRGVLRRVFPDAAGAA